MVFAIAIGTVVLIVLGALIGGMGILGGTETNNRHDHFFSRLVDWLF